MPQPLLLVADDDALSLLAGAAAALVLGSDDVVLADESAVGLSALLVADPVELPPRKSVTYQPDPLSWKPAAVNCLEKVSAPQAGHVVSKGSEIFCSTSLAWPQALQR